MQTATNHTAIVQLPNLVERLDRLERQNRRFKRGAMALACVVATAALMAADQNPVPQSLVAAKRFQLQDDAGRLRAELSLGESKEPQLSLYDDQNRERLSVRLGGDSDHGPEIWLFDEKGMSRAAARIVKGEPEFVTFHKETNTVMSRLSTSDKGGVIGTWNAKNQLCFAAMEKGTATKALEVSDEKGRLRAAVRLIDGAPEFVTFNKTSNRMMTRMAATDKGGVISSWSTDNKTNLMSTSEGTASRRAIAVIDDEGRTRLQLAKGPKTDTYFRMNNEAGDPKLIMFVGDQEGNGSCAANFYDAEGKRVLLNLGAANNTGFVSGFDSNNSAVFGINSDGMNARKFQKMQ